MFPRLPRRLQKWFVIHIADNEELAELTKRASPSEVFADRCAEVLERTAPPPERAVAEEPDDAS